MTNAKSRANSVATALIALGSIAGGLFLTEHYTGAISAAISQSGSPSASGSTSASPAGKTGTATGDAFPYQFGTIQLSVTKTSGKITDVGLVQASASGGREQAFSMLVKAAIDTQGTGFANISGATYTTDTFKQALDSAIKKLG
jgi:uncharacterized protein with FMN-binding domain